MPYLIMVVMLLIPYLQFLVSGAATAQAASTETEVAIATGDAGSAKAYYSVDKANHQINWRLQLNQVAADKMRHAEFAIENVGTGLGEVTGLQVKDATTGAVTNEFVQTAKSGVNWQIGADAQTQKDYEVTFQTAYQANSETTLQLKFAYKIEQAITETTTAESESATETTPTESTPAVTESSASSATTESGTNAQATSEPVTEATTDQTATSDNALQVTPTQSSSSASLQPTAAVVAEQPTSYENILTGEQVVTIAPETVAEEEVAAEDDSAAIGESETNESDEKDSTTESVKDNTDETESNEPIEQEQADAPEKKEAEGQDTRATGILQENIMINGINSGTQLGFSQYNGDDSNNANANGKPETSVDIDYSDQVSFALGWSSMSIIGIDFFENILQVRTQASGETNWSNWQEVMRANGDNDWSGSIDLGDLGGGEFGQIEVVNNNDGSLTFQSKEATTNKSLLQFRIVGPSIWLIGRVNSWVSNKIAFQTKDDSEFKLTVPGLNFGDLERFDQKQSKEFAINLEKNTEQTPFKLTAANEPISADGDVTDPFRREDLLFSQNGAEESMNVGNDITLIDNQANPTSDSLRFAIQVPRGYASGKHQTNIKWKLSFDN